MRQSGDAVRLGEATFLGDSKNFRLNFSTQNRQLGLSGNEYSVGWEPIKVVLGCL